MPFFHLQDTISGSFHHNSFEYHYQFCKDAIANHIHFEYSSKYKGTKIFALSFVDIELLTEKAKPYKLSCVRHGNLTTDLKLHVFTHNLATNLSRLDGMVVAIFRLYESP